MNNGSRLFPPTPLEASASEKNHLTTGLLAIFLGILGAHRFYLGKIGSGLAQLFTFGGLGLWVLVDVLVILFGTVKDAQGKVLKREKKSARILYIIFGFLVFVALVAPKDSSGPSSADGTRGDISGRYGRTDNSYTSRIIINSDKTIRAEIATGWGYCEKAGSYTVNGDTVNVNWDDISFKNLLGSPPDLPKKQTLQWGVDSQGDGYVQIGETRYWK